MSQGSTPRKDIQEFRRTCRKCGKVWHSLSSREAALQRRNAANLCHAVSCCANPTSAQYTRNAEATQDELARLKRCPNCLSNDYAEEVVLHEPKGGFIRP